MLGNLRGLVTGGTAPVWKKFLTFAVATGLAASMTLGATPVSATVASWDSDDAPFALEVDNTAPQWGDVITFSATVDWSSCRRVPNVYLIGTSDNGDPINVRLTGERADGFSSSKVISYEISYGGEVDGVPYDDELTPSERTALNDSRLAAGWHSFELKATSTRANCSLMGRVMRSDPVGFYVGPQLTSVSFTTNATYEFLFSNLFDYSEDDFTTGLITIEDENGDGFEAGNYDNDYTYELSMGLGDAVSITPDDWLASGEIVGDTLTVDATAGVDWSDGANASGVNCYLDNEVENLEVEPLANGHHIVGDTEADDCAALDIDLGEHTLTLEYWIDSCTEVELDCLSWTTYTFDFARVENQDALPYELDFVDASTGVSLDLEDDYYWGTDDYSNGIMLGPDDSNGIEIVADLPFGADLSCVYDEDGIPLSVGDVFFPVGSEETYLDCTVTPEDPSAESFEYRVTIDRQSDDLGFDELRIFTEEDELSVDDSPMDTHDVRVDYTAGLATWEDDTAGLELTLSDPTTDFVCYAADEGFDKTSEVVDCSDFELDTPYDSTTGIWLELTAEDGSTVEYLIVIEHTVVSTDATLKDDSTGLQYLDDGVTYDVAACSDFETLDYGIDYVDWYTPFDGDHTIDWCVVHYVDDLDLDDGDDSGWYLYGTDSSTGTWLTTPTYYNDDNLHADVDCDNLRYASDSASCDEKRLASRTDNSDDVVDGWNDFDLTVTAEDDLVNPGTGTTETYEASVYRVDDNAYLENLRVFTKAGLLMQLRDVEGDAVDYDKEVLEYWVEVRDADMGVAPGRGVDINETLFDAEVQVKDCYVGPTGGVMTLNIDCDNIIVPSTSTDGEYAAKIEVEAENGDVNTYWVYFRYRTFGDGLSGLKVDGNDVVDHTSGIGGSFDGDAEQTWYWVTDNVEVDVSATLDESPRPGLEAHCYREGIYDADCNDISLVESDWTTIQVITKTGGHTGTTYETYTIEVYRQSTVKTLATLTANNGSAMTLSPSFSPTTYTYAASSVSGLIDVEYTTTSLFATAECVDDDDIAPFNCQDIDVSDGDVEVTITVTAENGDVQTYTLNLTEVPPMPSPEYLSRASVLGTSTSGRTLTANVGTWRYQPTYAYQWFRCNSAVSLQRGGLNPAGCSAISGATSSTYRLVAADRTKFVLVKITGTNAGGNTHIYTNSTRAVR